MSWPDRMDTDDGDLGAPEVVLPESLPKGQVPEISMVEAEDVTGVTFSPELWMQRRQWAMSVLRKEGVRSLLDMGCGQGALLETLVIPPATVFEPPLRPKLQSSSASQLPSPVDSDAEEDAQANELYITRLGGLDSSPSVFPAALSILTPPSQSSSSFPPRLPRWEELRAELWLGGIEKYNARLEGYEAITCMEIIEHLEPNVLSRFGVVTMGTYRPRLLLITTPNFDFNAKFPRHHEDEEHNFARKGFIDPTGRTERVFRHSDHKVEMTTAEFREWAEAAAADWGYDVEISGVGISNKPSYYPADHPTAPNQPIFATQTAVFRLASLPTRSPRSVRSVQLPFMPGSKESSHPHKLAGNFVHPKTATGRRIAPAEVRQMAALKMQGWGRGEASLEEVWGCRDIAEACAGSRRYLVGSLGGWGDCEAIDEAGAAEWEVRKVKGQGFKVVWKGWVPPVSDQREEWGRAMEVERDDKAGGW